jgi:hypothetical protein
LRVGKPDTVGLNFLPRYLPLIIIITKKGFTERTYESVNKIPRV